ncbi:hypothetical protein HPB47_005641 [Ixodes persulcatus]|uniref:Uncharacterized protein n=1 Tax=Ixodes persulcatus TaxID=34615 RepID=A0AC60PDC5_IXOPE|nr:hypothetical protein HPB47_005641 [Ixodes persulcatus]
MLSFYPTTTRTRKWTVRTIIFTIDAGVVNSWLLYKVGQVELHSPRKKVMQLLDFKFQLSHYLLPAE